LPQGVSTLPVKAAAGDGFLDGLKLPPAQALLSQVPLKRRASDLVPFTRQKLLNPFGAASRQFLTQFGRHI
jgi:hypothetical protein